MSPAAQPRSSLSAFSGTDALLIYGASAAMAGVLGVFTAAKVSGLLEHGRAASVKFGGLGPAVTALIRHPGRTQSAFPGAGGPGVFYPVLLLVLAAALALAVVARRWYMGIGTGGGTADGFASKKDVQRVASETAVRRSAAQTRPSLDAKKAEVEDLGYPLGHARRPYLGRASLWGGWEDMVRLIAPSGWGKTLRVLVPIVRSFPGAAIVASTKPDLFELTVTERRRRGPVAALDPELLAIGACPPARWNPVLGCEDTRVAESRAAAFVSGAIPASKAASSESDFFRLSSVIFLKSLLHAAALAGLTMREVAIWCRDLEHPEPRRILRTHPLAAPGWDEDLDTQVTGAPETTSGVKRTIALAMGCFAHPEVMDMVCPKPGEEFDFESFIQAGGTVYLLGRAQDDSGGGVAPLLTAFAEQWLDVAEALAVRQPTRRMDPIAGAILDEAPSITPIPSLTRRAAEGRGKGLWIIYALQSWSQERSRWGEAGSETLFDTVKVTMVCGGMKNPRDLETLETLLGKKKVYTTGRSNSAAGQVVSEQQQWESVLTASEVSQLDDGQALMLWGNVPAFTSYLPGIWERPGYAELKQEELAVRGVVNGARAEHEAKLAQWRREGMAAWRRAEEENKTITKPGLKT